MAFEIILQYNQSERERLDKRLTTISTLQGTLKSETSIVDPVIIFETDIATVRDCNYITISAFRRQYFVNNIRSIRTNLIEFSCHCDVLSSFKQYIRENRAIIQKQESLWNLYLNDGSLHIYQNPDVLTMPFPSGFDTQEFVLAVAGS